MKIDYHDRFVKHYTKRIRPNGALDTAFARRMNTFLQNSKHPLLRDHALTGDLIGFRSFFDGLTKLRAVDTIGLYGEYGGNC